MSENDADAPIHQGAPQNEQAAPAASPPASPSDAELHRQLTEAHATTVELDEQFERLRHQFAEIRALAFRSDQRAAVVKAEGDAVRVALAFVDLMMQRAPDLEDLLGKQ